MHFVFGGKNLLFSFGVVVDGGSFLYGFIFFFAPSVGGILLMSENLVQVLLVRTTGCDFISQTFD